MNGSLGGAIVPSEEGPLWECGPGRNLVRLLEIMERFKALGEFLDLTRHVSRAIELTRNEPGPFDEQMRALFGNDLLAGFQDSCSALRFVCSAATVGRIRKALESPELTIDAISVLLNEFLERYIDEAKSVTLLYLAPKEAEYYEKPRQGWEEVIARFPETVSDVEEARKCFALSRYAAAIFHALHVVESCLIELGSFIGVSDPQSGWTAVSHHLAAILKKNYKELTEFERTNRPFLEQVYGTVEGLKNAWRNKVSHTHGKLTLITVDFTPEIAEEILFATRSFARRLADGLPPAR